MSRRLSASWAAMGSPAPKGTPVKHAPNLLGINEDEAELESIRARRKSNAAALTPVKGIPGIVLACMQRLRGAMARTLPGKR